MYIFSLENLYTRNIVVYVYYWSTVYFRYNAILKISRHIARCKGNFPLPHLTRYLTSKLTVKLVFFPKYKTFSECLLGNNLSFLEKMIVLWWCWWWLYEKKVCLFSLTKQKVPYFTAMHGKGWTWSPVLTRAILSVAIYRMSSHFKRWIMTLFWWCILYALFVF